MLFLSRSTHSCIRSKRLRTTEEPIALDGSSVLGSSKKCLGGSCGPKVRKSAVRSTCREEEKDKEANSKYSQFSGKNLCDCTLNIFRFWSKACFNLTCRNCVRRHHFYVWLSIYLCDYLLSSFTFSMMVPFTFCSLCLNRCLQTNVCGEGKESREWFCGTF